MSSLTRLWGGGGNGRGHKTIPMAQSHPTLAPLVASATPQSQPAFHPPPPRLPQPVVKPVPPPPQLKPQAPPLFLPPSSPTPILQPPLPPISQRLPPPPTPKTRQATNYLPPPLPSPAKPNVNQTPQSLNGSVVTTGPGSKDSWGPKVWQILHNMAWLSDRVDVFFIWKLMLKSLSDVMPCATCRQHLSQYLNTNSLFLVKNIHLLKGSEVKTRMVQALWALHNDVNVRTGKGIYTLEELNMMYLNASRAQVLNETYRLLTEIYHEWEPIVVKQITGGAFREWRANTIMFMSLAAAGPL